MSRIRYSPAHRSMAYLHSPTLPDNSYSRWVIRVVCVEDEVGDEDEELLEGREDDDDVALVVSPYAISTGG